MKFSQDIAKFLLNAESKALATNGVDGINVVPVSTVKVVDGHIWLVDYFFGKTRENIQKNPNDIALTFWSGLSGYQVKAHSMYQTEGVNFEATVAWIAKLHPERKVKGLLILEPRKVYDIGIG